MEQRELKDLSVYDKRFEEDPSSFNDFQAMDYVKELKNQGRTDDAIEAGKTFLQVGDNLAGFINHYGYALYNKFINISDDEIKEKEDLFFSIVDEITSLCKHEKYSPFEVTLNKATKYLMNQDPVDFGKVSMLLDKLDPQDISAEPFTNKEGKEFESRRERWFRLKVRALYENKQYRECLECANIAYTQPLKWHYNSLSWIKYYRASSLVQLERYTEAENEFISLGNKIPSVNSFEILYQLYMQTGREKEAYTNLIYKFFNSGYKPEHLSLYEKILDIVKTQDNQDILDLATALIYKIKEELKQDVTGLTITEDYSSLDSSALYDRFYNKFMENLGTYIERHEGKIVYYNSDKEFGSIYQDQDDNLFFRQADYIHDEAVEKRDIVEYSIIKTFDVKKQIPTTKAVLLKTLYEDIYY